MREEAQPPADGLVRVTVASATRRVDLMLPTTVPVAELVPELARSVGMLDPTTAHDGHRLVTVDGQGLVDDASLAAQGIVDGQMLAMVTGKPEPAQVYEDVAEAMADVVERDRTPWDPVWGRHAALITAALLAAFGAFALVMVGSVGAGASAAALALGLTGGAVVLSRVRREAETALGVAGAAGVYAAVAGFVLAPQGALHAPSLAYAGAGAGVIGLASLVGLCENRSLALPSVAAGAVLMTTASVTGMTAIEPAVILTAVLTIVVMIGSFVPSLALGLTGTRSAHLLPVDLDRVSADARLAHQILLAVSATVGLLLVIGAPFAVSLGPSGVALAVTCSLVVMLRTRRHQAASQVKVGLVSGITGLLSVATTTLWLHSSWRPAAASLLATAGVVALLGATLLPSTPSVRRDRLCDLLESAALLATPPLLMVATGIVAAIRG